MSLVRNFESLGLNSTTQYGKESLTLMIHLGQSSSLPSADLQPIVRYAVSLLAASLTNIEHYQGHEWQKEAVPLTLLESKSSASDPAVKALEALHSVLFPRSGLANALHCQDWKSYSMADLVAYKKRALSSQKATHDTGPASTLYKLWTFGLADDQTAHLTESLVEPLVRSMMQSLPAAAPKESRQERKGTESPSSLPSHASKESWIEGPSADYQASMAWRTPFTSPAELVALWTLQAHLAKGVSRLAATENKHAHHLSTTHPISLQYRDTGVLGYRLSGFATEDKAVEAGRALYAALRSALSKPSAASLEQDLPALKSMVKSNLLDHLSHRISAIPMYSLLQESQLESIFSLVDRVKVENVTKVTNPTRTLLLFFSCFVLSGIRVDSYPSQSFYFSITILDDERTGKRRASNSHAWSLFKWTFYTLLRDKGKRSIMSRSFDTLFI